MSRRVKLAGIVALSLVVIEGGNHAGFGHYGPQAGDGVASIDREEQQRQTAETVLAFALALP